MRCQQVNEVSFYLDNHPGMLSELAQKFFQAGVWIFGIQAYEGQIQSMVRMVVDKVDTSEKVLKSYGAQAISLSKCLEVKVRSKPGGLAEITGLLGKHGINIDSFHSSDGPDEYGYAFFRVSDIDQAEKLINSELPDL